MLLLRSNAKLVKVDAELKEAKARRDAIKPVETSLPEDLPSVYRAHIEDIVNTLSDKDVSGRAGDVLHELLDRVVVSYDQDAKNHILDMQGNLITMLKKAKPAEVAGIDANEISLKLVAGGRNRRKFPRLKCTL